MGFGPDSEVLGTVIMDDPYENLKAENSLEVEELEPEIPLERITREQFQELSHDGFDPVGDIKWVFHALAVDGLKPEDAPSPGAWILLQELRNDEGLLRSFYATTFPKVLPNKAQMERDNNRVEDGREEFDLIDRLLREPDDLAPIFSDTEERARQLALSAQGA